ncbi:cation-translocating P-type ATPase [Brevibacillus sp. SYP-B805]|uniref:cation-translocating P-type ATPase n=1 Tax=Brevibacillus sp. SYP-B805 TaxID=1578199 RepID=UPI0013ED248B|nr:HAD-IC family P-type ATPase [Brevibacillus sp. SYP-B805]NGQ95785.1 cation-translocating P-type ATPase [Brevibacillus sp. SYP-B805]
MHSLEFKKRFLRILPGRIRVEICGLQQNAKTAELLKSRFSTVKGICKVDPCTASGRLLVVYDEKTIGAREILGIIQAVERHMLQQEQELSASDSLNQPMGGPIEGKAEAAAAMETETVSKEDQAAFPPLDDGITYVPKMLGKKRYLAANVPLPLAVSMGGLALLGLKRLWMGRSALASRPGPFYLSALVSIATGYPLIRRGLRQYSQDRKWNTDLILGASALALALVRENLIVLAGISILQYVEWQRSQASLKGEKEASLPPEIQRYAEKAGKWGMIAAGAAWALTRDPLRGIAVLLAANPRIATLPAEVAWKQAEQVSHHRHYPIPANGTLAKLAHPKTLLVEDSSFLFANKQDDLQFMTKEKEPEKIVCLAASLMKKGNHPWKEDIWEKAEQTCRTIRTAYQVETDEHGIQGKVNGSLVFVGNFEYLQQKGIDCSDYLLDAKRLSKKGCHVLFIGKQASKGGACVGLLFRQQEIASRCGETIHAFSQKGWRIGILHNSLNMEPTMFSKHGVDTGWLALQPEELVEQIAVKRQQGEEVLFVAGEQPSPSQAYLNEMGIPSIEFHRLPELLETVGYAEQVDQTVRQHFGWAKCWNGIATALATFGVLSAPVVNLAADALSLVFLARAKTSSEKTATIPPALNMYQPEVAAAAETTPVSWHAVSWKEAANYFMVDARLGLSTSQVAELRNRFGSNRLEERKPTSWLTSFLGQFKEFPSLILLGTCALSVVTGGLFDGIAMGCILLANAAIGVIQERKAEEAVAALDAFQVPMCKVIRDGQQLEISASELVPGDIVAVEAGDRVPADLRLMQSSFLQVNESALTGESLPVEKEDCLTDAECPLPERKNMLYMGTDVCRGKGMGIVVQTGMGTELGHLSALLHAEEIETTPLQEKVASISKKFVKGAFLAAGVVFLAGLFRGIPVSQMITTSITLAASAIPEGLPVTITIALTAGVFRMAKKNALIRKLFALESLGRVTVICTDKTGTLTKNEMTVKAIATADRAFTVTGTGYEPIGIIEEIGIEAAAASAVPAVSESAIESRSNADLERLLQICLLCNNSKLEQQDGQWIVKGDPTEGALLTLAAKAGYWQQNMTHWHRGLEVPFDSSTGKMSVMCKDTASGKDCYVFSKGAVETILRHCNRYQVNGRILPLTEAQKQAIMLQNEKLSQHALRVLAFAYRPLEKDEAEGIDENEMIYVGLAGMIDPPKPYVDKSIAEARSLGIKPVMITGDHPITAIAIARQLGIYDGTQKVLSGHELDRLSDEELSRQIDDVSVFARVTPDHKLRIVKALQKRGHIVAMTGDGVNDSPAIKQANVGIAMGLTGTEVTKQAADMVLIEDHFGSIVDGVKNGRTIIGNIRKALGCLLTGNLAEILVTSMAVIAGLPIPLVPIQILLMNLLTDALPAMILAVNPGNKNKQLSRTDIADAELYRKIVTRGVLLGAASLGLFAFSLASGASLALAQTVAFTTLVTGQLLQTFSWRQEGSEESIRDWSTDRFFMGALGASWLALLTALYLPPVARFFHTVPIPLGYWVPILLVGGSVSILSKPAFSLLAKMSKKQETITLNNPYAVAM